MIEKPLDKLSKDELISELQQLRDELRPGAPDEADRQRVIHDLHVHQIELEMQNRELRETQSRLEAATLRYADLYDFAPVGYCTLTPEGTITEINLTAAAFFGVTRDKLLGRSFRSVAPLKERRPFEEHLERCRNEKIRVTSEVTFLLGTRGARTVQLISEPMLDASALVTAYRTILVDISGLKELENKLRLLSDAGQSLSSSLDYTDTLKIVAGVAVPVLADLCMVDVLTEDGRQERFVAFADARKQEKLAGRMKEFRPRPGWETTSAQVIATGVPLLLPEVTDEVRKGISHDKHHFDALTAAEVRSLMVVPLSARGRTFGAVSLAAGESGRRYSPADLRLAQDLAHRAATAVDNARLYAEAQRAIAGRDQVLAMVSHDLRNPLANIILRTSMLKEPREARSEELHASIERIRHSAEQMNRMIEDLLDVSSIEAGQLSIKRSPQAVGSLLSDAIEGVKVLATTKSLRLESDFPAGDRFAVDGDRDRVLQVLTNLIGNAIKFTSEGGRIIVRVEPQGREIQFSVIDTGPGIAPADLTHIFDRFWRAQKTTRTGTGLGLSIAKGIVETHGGRIWAESQLGSGSTFIFTLPLALPKTREADDHDLPETVQPARKPAVTTEANPLRRVVLIAEDDADIREVLGHIVEQAGYQAAPVANGAEALEYLHREAPPFVILLDLMMPVLDGWSFLAERNHDATLRAIPVVVLTALRDVADEVAAAHASYCQKPIMADRLIEAIERCAHAEHY